MNIKKFLYQVCLSLTLVLIHIGTCFSIYSKFIVSIPDSQFEIILKNGERITEYKIQIHKGHVTSVLKIPADWWIKINPQTEKIQIEAFAGHGASWLSMVDVGKGAFSKFLVIETESSSLPELRMELSVDSPSYEEERHVVIEGNAVEIAPLGNYSAGSPN